MPTANGMFALHQRMVFAVLDIYTYARMNMYLVHIA